MKKLSLEDIGLPPIEDQLKIVELIEGTINEAKFHATSMYIKSPTIKSKYEQILSGRCSEPTGNDVKEIVKLITSKGYSKAAIARMIGVSDNGNRTLNRWKKGGDESSSIPYAAWRLLCSYAGVSIDLMLKDKER